MKLRYIAVFAITMNFNSFASEIALKDKAVCLDQNGQEVGVAVVHYRGPQGLSIIANVFDHDALKLYRQGISVGELESEMGSADYNPSVFDGIDVKYANGEVERFLECKPLRFPFLLSPWNKLLSAFLKSI